MTPCANTCWVCGGQDLLLYRQGSINKALVASDFAITDYNYGLTGTLFKCRSCGFIQCTDVGNPSQYYEQLEDQEYEQGRAERALQAKAILQSVVKKAGNSFEKSGPLKLLDIGAGSGILVEEAQKMGMDAAGVEPSEWLAAQAVDKELSVHRGVLPHKDISGVFDIVTIIDVIEHVDDPSDMIRQAKRHLAPNGVMVVITPDVRSFAARALGAKWWHFRIAHIGYFSRDTLLRLTEANDLKCVSVSRPGWYFQLSYLLERGFSYLPSFLRITPPDFTRRVTVPLNLLDSLMVILSPKSS